MSHNNLFHIVIFHALIFLVAPLKADTLHLKNGDIISGKIMTFQERKVSIINSYGNGNSFPSIDIKAIKTDDVFDIKFSNGE